MPITEPSTSKAGSFRQWNKGYNQDPLAGGDNVRGNAVKNEEVCESVTVEQLLKELGQESKMLYINWSSALSESENFEFYCQKSLDSLIKEALGVEATLKRQKEKLRQRLQHLSKTLQGIK